jgi:hypothetical protein
MTMTLAEAFDVVAWSQTLLERLEVAQGELDKKQGLHDEKGWLMLAIDRLGAARGELGDLTQRAMRLPELESAREEHARTLQNAAVDAVERLQAGVTFVAGTRAPLLEALFGKVKLPQARRADRDDFERFVADFDKKLSSSYCKRIMAESSFGPVLPVVDQVRGAVAAWRAGFSPEPLTPSEESLLRDEIVAHARRLELPMRQARLLAEASLAPLKNAFDDSGIGQKPRRRKAEVEQEPPVKENSVPVEVEAELQAPKPLVESVTPKRRSKNSAEAEA